MCLYTHLSIISHFSLGGVDSPPPPVANRVNALQPTTLATNIPFYQGPNAAPKDIVLHQSSKI